MNYNFIKEVIKGNGEDHLDISLETFMDRVDDPNHPWFEETHISLIENYRYDRHGRLVLLVKNSYGHESYDNGYLHLGEDYLRVALANISIVEME